jgi:hypothetical protein
MAEIFIAIFLLFIQPTVASSEEQTRFYSSDGKSQGTATPQSDGTVKFRDAQGRTVGTSTTDPSGQTRYYGPDGKSLGTSTGPTRAPFPQR